VASRFDGCIYCTSLLQLHLITTAHTLNFFWITNLLLLSESSAGLKSLDFYYSERLTVEVTLRLTVSQSVSLGVEPHLGLMTRYILLFDNYGLCFCGAPSLTRGRVCLLYMLLALASAVFLESESLGTRDHILLYQISDFPFRRLLRLAGSRCRYSTPPSHGSHSLGMNYVILWPGADRKQNTHLKCSSVVICVSVAMGMLVYQTVVQQRSIPQCHGNVFSEALPSRWSYFGFLASRHNMSTFTGEKQIGIIF
jgi:hypothetical protein